MKTCTRTIIAIAGLVVLGAAAAANAGPDDVVAKVPFAFTIGTTHLPRDTYRISRVNAQADVLMIRSLRRGLFVPGQRDGSIGRNESPRLVFHRYGDRYFLREVLLLERRGFRFPETREEREAAERIANSAGDGLEVVAVALQ